ncbi:MAG: nuclear transport factor 2 family protein [Chitinophagaceae bacterium]|nr:nuclear transport factor 2 family protein [Chitinophagaceae bacterium]
MKILLIVLGLFLSSKETSAQSTDSEAEIRKLEQTEVQAVLDKDTVTLKRLWDRDYVVNNPENAIVLARTNPLDRPVLRNQRISFTRVVEKVILNDQLAISMGHETVISTNPTTQAEQIIKRRYTNIWMKKAEGWKLVARHANKICG